MTVNDQIFESFYDVGTDTLGAGDSIVAGCDTYTWASSRNLVSTLTDQGDSATPYVIKAYSSDDTNLAQTGSDTLTTDGHIYATVTYQYSEQTSDNATVSQSVSGNGGWQRVGTATDTYSVTDSGTITYIDGVASSSDSFTVLSSHSISGSVSTSSSDATKTVTDTDSGSDSAVLRASGTKSTSAGDAFTFTDTESSTDNFVLNKTKPNVMNGNATVSASQTSSMSGSTSGGAFSSTQYVQQIHSVTESGSVTVSGVASPFATLNSHSESDQIAISGPVASTVTTTLGNSTSTSGADGGANMTETAAAGGGATAGTQVAAEIGSSPLGSAEHQGTSPNSLDTSSGLLSALGGEAVHAMSFSGSEIAPKPNPAGTSMWLEESNQSGQTPTSWVSHPSGIGYRRSSPGVTTWNGSTSSTSPPIPGSAPTMDSGTTDGGPDQELNRLGNFINGGNENPTSTRPGPTPRAQQIDMPMFPFGSPAATNLLLTNPDARMPVSTTPYYPAADGSVAVAPVSAMSVDGKVLGGRQGGPRSLGQDAADQWGSFLNKLQNELRMLPGTFWELPGAALGSFGSGEAFDSFQGTATHSKLMCLGKKLADPLGLIPEMSSTDPMWGHKEAFDQGANVIAPLADEAAIQATIGKILGPLGCVGPNATRAARIVAMGLKLAKLGLAGAAAVNALQSLQDAIAKGDSVAAMKSLIALAGALYAIFAGACFAAGTPILTPDGSKLIEDIRPGDWVMTAPDDDPDAEPVPRQVEETFENYVPILDLYVNGRTIRTTAEHPFWVKDRGWVAAQQLQAGDSLRAHDGRWLKVDGLEGPKPSATVYNMCVAEYHTYFVGHQIWGFAIWSHNADANCLQGGGRAPMRTTAQNRAARNKYKNNKAKARAAYEKRTGEDWPTDENGNNWPGEHDPPLKNWGDPMTVTPRDPGLPDPHNIPGSDGLTDYQKWGRSARWHVKPAR
jgi:hypothetical protein